MNPTYKFRLLIADDDPASIRRTKSLIIPEADGFSLYEDERVELVKSNLEIKEVNSIPEAQEHLKKAHLPDITIVDLNFKYARRHLENRESNGTNTEEGIILIQSLTAYPGMYVFCLSAYIDWGMREILEMNIQDRAIGKNDEAEFTQKIGETLRELAMRQFASLNEVEQTRVYKALDEEDWRTIKLSVYKKRFLLKDLMVGWAVIQYDDQEQKGLIRYPADIIEIIKSYLPYAQKNQTINS